MLRESGDPLLRHEICWNFHIDPAVSAREALLERCFDGNVEVRNAAADAYEKVGRVEDGPILMGAYRLERSVRVKSDLLKALGAIRYQPAVPLLITLLDDERFRGDAIVELGEMCGPEAREALVCALNQETDEGWRRAIEKRIMLLDGHRQSA